MKKLKKGNTAYVLALINFIALVALLFPIRWYTAKGSHVELFVLIIALAILSCSVGIKLSYGNTKNRKAGAALIIHFFLLLLYLFFLMAIIRKNYLTGLTFY